jgi:hypothetical protein
VCHRAPNSISRRRPASCGQWNDWIEKGLGNIGLLTTPSFTGRSRPPVRRDCRKAAFLGEDRGPDVSFLKLSVGQVRIAIRRNLAEQSQGVRLEASFLTIVRKL